MKKNTKKTIKDKKWLFVFTGGLLILILLALTVFNPPQCPDYYTQAQVDASNCIIGANIGLGIVLVFILPVILITAAILGVHFMFLAYRELTKNSKSSKKK